MLLSLITNMAAVTSPANQQLPVDLSLIPINKGTNSTLGGGGQSTVEPLYNGHRGDRRKCLLWRGGLYVEVRLYSDLYEIVRLTLNLISHWSGIRDRSDNVSKQSHSAIRHDNDDCEVA